MTETLFKNIEYETIDDSAKNVEFPTLQKIIDSKNSKWSIGLSQWTKRMIYEEHEGKKYVKCVETTLLKADDVKYEIEETDTEVNIRYYWEDYV